MSRQPPPISDNTVIEMILEIGRAGPDELPSMVIKWRSWLDSLTNIDDLRAPFQCLDGCKTPRSFLALFLIKQRIEKDCRGTAKTELNKITTEKVNAALLSIYAAGHFPHFMSMLRAVMICLALNQIQV
jgi:hypothetical protein